MESVRHLQLERWDVNSCAVSSADRLAVKLCAQIRRVARYREIVSWKCRETSIRRDVTMRRFRNSELFGGREQSR